MAKNITGVAVQLGNRKWRFSEEAGAPMATEQRATLVLSEERVFTESEVRELLRGMMQLIDGDPEQVLAAIEAVNAKHGLGLSDPA